MEWDSFTACNMMPEDSPGRGTVLVPLNANHAFSLLGWWPDGRVRSQYQVLTSNEHRAFEAFGYTDVDGDGEFCTWATTHSTPVEMIVHNNVY